MIFTQNEPTRCGGGDMTAGFGARCVPSKATKIHLIYLLAIEFIHFNDYIYHFGCMYVYVWIHSHLKRHKTLSFAMKINFHIYKILL